jgi:hypothetical protein
VRIPFEGKRFKEFRFAASTAHWAEVANDGSFDQHGVVDEWLK